MGSIPAGGTKNRRFFAEAGIEQERGRENSSFPVEEGWENRGFPRGEIVKRPAEDTLYLQSF